MKRNMASILATGQLIEDALGIPSDHKIVGAQWDFVSNSVRLFVEGPCLPEVDEGDTVKDITPICYASEDNRGSLVRTWDLGCS